MKSKAKDHDSVNLGVKDFLKLMYDGQPEWALLAVKAPMDEVSEEFAEFRGGNVMRDVPKKPGAEYGDVAMLIPVIHIKNNSWTVILRSVLYLDESHLDAVVEEAKELSARLNTRALTFVGEDTSGANAYKLFEKGKLLEDLEWETGGDFFRFKSSLRKRPATEAVGDEVIDEVFREHGIYLPACYPMSDDGNGWLAVEKSSLDRIERVDLIDLGEEEDSDDEEDEE